MPKDLNSTQGRQTAGAGAIIPAMTIGLGALIERATLTSRDTMKGRDTTIVTVETIGRGTMNDRLARTTQDTMTDRGTMVDRGMTTGLATTSGHGTMIDRGTMTADTMIGHATKIAHVTKIVGVIMTIVGTTTAPAARSTHGTTSDHVTTEEGPPTRLDEVGLTCLRVNQHQHTHSGVRKPPHPGLHIRRHLLEITPTTTRHGTVGPPRLHRTCPLDPRLQVGRRTQANLMVTRAVETAGGCVFESSKNSYLITRTYSISRS